MITVIGVGLSPLPEQARDRLAEAALVVGSARQLAVAERTVPRSQDGPERRSFELGGDLGPALNVIAASSGPVVVLASGDPGFFGIVRTLAEQFGRRRLEVIPGVSAVATAFAKAGLPWDDALVVSAHGRDPGPAINACLAHPKVAVLTAPGFGPAELAAVLRGHPRRLLVAERLGEPDERVVEGDPAEIAGKRVLAIEDGPTLTHGEMAYGAAVLAAKANGACELIDPRPFAVGSIARTFEDYPNVGALLPAMGYGRKQMDDLKATIEACNAELVLIGTPIDLRKLIDFDVPALRITYRLQEVGEPTLADVLEEHGLIGDKALV
jgi:precorrin-6y C5,15-methyltransferase (decarboxylating) CbiE subunit